jgi:predicted permease
MKLFSWLRPVFQRGKLESEMDAELRFHIESYTADLMEAGSSQSEALRRARLEFGNVELQKDECRASLGLRWWDEWRGDLVYGVRMLRKSPGFTAVAVVSLALGIGANTAIFTMASRVLYKTMAVPESGRLRMLNWVQHPHTEAGPAWGFFDKNKLGETVGSPFPYPLYLNLRTRLAATADLTAFKDVSRLTANATGEAESIDGELVAGNFYHVLGAKLSGGRPITEADDTPTAPPVAVISDAYWARRFGRAADVVGKTIQVNALSVAVIGVNSAEFHGAKICCNPEIFLPISLQPRLVPHPRGSLIANANFWWVCLIGRLQPDVSPESAQVAAEIEFHRSLRATIPEKPLAQFPGLILAAGNRGLDSQTQMFAGPLHLLLGAAGLVLLIACVNLANLLLARGSARQREIGVRLAMGAGRFRIFRQALTESMLLAVLGGAAGLAAGYAGRNLLPTLFEDSWHGRALENQFDWKVFAFAALATLATGLVFGIAPALRLNSGDTSKALQDTRRMSYHSSRTLFGKSLVVFQVGLSVLLLIGAGLFIRTLVNLRSAPIGFNPERLLLFELDPPRSRYTGAKRVAVLRQIEEKLNALPGVQLATLSSEPLLADSMDNNCVRPTGRAPGTKGDGILTNDVGERFFETMEMPIVAGRSFHWHDNQHAPRVAIVNRKLAQKFFPSSGALGKTISFCEANDPSIEIVGVAADAKYAAVNQEPPPTLFRPYLQQDDAEDVTFEIKTAASTDSMVKLIRTALRSVDRDLPLLDIRTQTQQIDATLTQQRMFASLTGGFGVLALLLAGIGIYGIMAYNVSRRTNEIGIRMALGAQARSVLAMVLHEAWLLAGLGIVLGLAAALAVTRLLAAMLFGIEPNDPFTYCAAAFLLLAIALIAGAIPARRAASIDPCDALRHE